MTGEAESLVGHLLGSPLAPLSWGYGAAQRIRTTLYARGLLKTRKLPCKVISVGNLTSGGTGKTPLVERLAVLLRENGFKVAILSRGYGGRCRQDVALVSDGHNLLLTPSEAGDEPYLLARKLKGVPVLIGRSRHRVGRTAWERFGTEVALLDDGYQHLSLARDLDILLLDATRPFGNGWVLPRGMLREPVRAMGRAHAIVLTRCQTSASFPLQDRYPRWARNIPIVRSRHAPDSLVRVGCPGTGRTGEPGRARAKDEATEDPSFLHGRRVAAFCGVAHPDSFRNLILQLGGEIVDFLSFRDHHRYRPNEIGQIVDSFRSSRAEIALTTEKDEVKLAQESFPAGFPLWSLRIRLELTDGAKAFDQLILSTAAGTSDAPD